MLNKSLTLCRLTIYLKSSFKRNYATGQSELKSILEGIIPVYKEKVKELRKNYGKKRVCEVIKFLSYKYIVPICKNIYFTNHPL